MKLRPLLLAVLLSAAAIAATTEPDLTRRALALDGELVLAPIGCEPHAPIQLEVLASAVRGGVAEIEYRATPLIAALELHATIDEEPGAELLRHDLPDGYELERGSPRSGYARVRLAPEALAEGALVRLRVAVTFEGHGDDGQAALETQSIVRELAFGSPEPALELPEVSTAGVISLAVPAIITEGR